MQGSFVFLDGSSTGMGVVAILFACLGVFCFISAFFPQVKGTYESQYTAGLNLLMFKLHLAVAFCYLMGAIFHVWSSSWSTEWGAATSSALYLILNLVCGAGLVYIVSLKQKHMAESKRMGISEEEYYRTVIKPSLPAANKK